MIQLKHFLSSLLVSGLLLSQAPVLYADQILKPLSYGQKVQDKAIRSFANLGGSVLEFPKNVVSTTNQSNIFYGIIGGGFKGMVNVIGRLGVGMLELITIPFPTQPAVYPNPVWEDFDRDTYYAPIFRPYEDIPVAGQTMPTVEPEPTAPAVAPATTPTIPVDRSKLYNERTSQSLDRVFKKEMMK